MKISLIVIVVVLLVVLLGFGFYLHKHWSLEKEIASYPEYYKQLAQDCKSNFDIQSGMQSCCLASVRVMAHEDLKLLPESGCPDGYKRGGLRCRGSYSWCRPIE